MHLEQEWIHTKAYTKYKIDPPNTLVVDLNIVDRNIIHMHQQECRIHQYYLTTFACKSFNKRSLHTAEAYSMVIVVLFCLLVNIMSKQKNEMWVYKCQQEGAEKPVIFS